MRKGHAGQTLPLRTVLELVQHEAGKDLRALVLDALALEEAGLGPETPVKVQPLTSNQDQTPPWEALQLMAIPARSAPLLTTRRQWEVWPASARDLPDAVDNCVAEALANGHDSTGRFMLALDWYGGARDGSASATTRVLAAAPPGPGLANWSEWEALPGTDQATPPILVRDDTVSAAGLLLAALLCASFWLLARRSRRMGLTFLLLWLGAAGVALAWLPPALRGLILWPLLPAACTRCVPVYSRTLPPDAAQGADHSHRPGGNGRRLAPRFVGPPGHEPGIADGRAGRLRPTRSAGASRQAACSCPSESARRPASAGAAHRRCRRAVLLSASYEGKIVQGVAEIDAVYQAFCLSQDTATLKIPLDGVRLLGEVWLDGARAFPIALAATGRLRSQTVRRQAHKIELRFRVTVVRTDEDRDLQFTAPRLPQSRLRLQLPPAAAFAQAVSRCGAETLAVTPAGKTLEVDLGRLAGSVHLHWCEEALPPAPITVRYKEAYIWDLHPTTCV